MFFDRLGNHVTGEEPNVDEPIVESYYDPNRPVRPGFEKPQLIQEGLFDIFKKDPPFKSFEEMEEYTGSKVDPAFKKFNQSHNKGDIMNYPVSKIDDGCRKLIEEYYGNNTVSFNLFGEEDILKREGKYRDVIELNDYCTPFAEVVPDQDKNLDTLCLWIATDNTKSWKPGTVVLSEVINSDYPDDIYGIFAKSFKDFLKNATFGKDVKEYSEMDLDEMSDYIQEQVITESKKTHKQRFLERNKYDPETGTYETDILDENGKKIRVPLRISATGSNKMRLDPETGRPMEIVINRKTAKSKNWCSQITLKHEEGHVAQHMGKDKNHLGRGKELGEAQDYMFKERIPFSKIHGTAAFELDADRYAAEHVSKRSFIKRRERSIKDSLLALKNIKRKVIKIKQVDEEHIKKFIKNEFSIDVNKLHNELDILIKQCNADLNEFIHKKEIALSDMKYYENAIIKKQDEEDIKQCKDMIKMYERMILHYDEEIEKNPEKLKEYLDRVRKYFVDPYSKSLDFMINEAEERIKYVDKMVKESYIDDDEFVPREIILEEKINAAERNELDDDDFGLVYTDEDGKKVRKYPLTDENHIRQAVRFFSHCPDEHKPQLARKILKKANEHDMDTSNWETIHEWAKK